MILLINPCINQFVVITIWLPRFRHMTCSKHVKSTNMQHCSPDKNQSGDWTIQNSSPPTSSKEIKAKLHLQIFDTIFLPRPLLQKYVGQHLSTNDVIITIGFICQKLIKWTEKERKITPSSHPSPRSLRPSSSTANCSASGGRGCGNRASALGLPGDLHEMYLLENQKPWTLKGSLKMNSCWVVELFCLPKAGAYQEVAESLLSMLLRCKKQEKMDKKHRH